MGLGNGFNLATFTSPNGKVRVKYRTVFTAADGFSRSFLAMELSADDKVATVDAERLARWCVETFSKVLELQAEDGTWSEEPFTWEALGGLSGDHAADGWPAILAVDIWQKVVKVEATNLDALKKTLPLASHPVTPADSHPDQPSTTSTSSGPQE